MSSGAGRHRTGPDVAALAARAVVAAGLVVDAVVHLRLAAGYQLAAPGGIGEGTLFRIQAAVALVVALLVLVRGSRSVAVLAFVVAAAALGAVLLYRYVDVGPLGPLPAMYEPVWFPQKTLSAVAEAAAALAALGLLALTTRRRTAPLPAPAAGSTGAPAGRTTR